MVLEFPAAARHAALGQAAARDALQAGHLGEIAELHASRGELGAAESLFRRAAEILCAIGGDRLEAAQACNRLAFFHRDMGWDGEAARFFRKAWDLAREVLADDDPSCAVLLCNLAGACRELGDLEAAESFYSQALEVFVAALGEDHPESARTRGELAALHRDRGDLTTALLWARRALEEMRHGSGEPQQDLPAALVRLAGLYCDTSDFAAARSLLLEADSLLRRQHGDTDAEILESALRLAEVSFAMGDYAEAERLFRLVLGLEGDAAKPDRDRLEICRHRLGLLVRHRGDSGGEA